jgi:hydrophobic/amphiphilic exporter-1 (mainly G- bacteria), HAE1 family
VKNLDLYTFSIKRPVTVTVIVLALIVISFVFFARINIEGFPKIEVPIIAVSTVYRGAGPAEVEEQVTTIIEEAVGSVGNIKQIESLSQDNSSLVIVELQYGTNLDTAAADIREKIDRARRLLPADIENPVVIKADPSDQPIIRLTLSDQNNNLRRLRSIAENDVRKELEKIGGIASVRVTGGVQRAIMIKTDSERLQALSIPVEQVVGAIARENVDVPVGRVRTSELEFSVRTIGKIDSVRDFEEIMVGTIDGKAIFLRDVASVVDGTKEVRAKSRVNGKPCVTIDVRKNTDANLVNVAGDVKKRVDSLRQELPPGFELTVAFDQSVYILSAIKNLQETAIMGGILAIFIVLLFLRSVKSTLVICISIPVSIILTFLLFYFNDVTINMITLLAFILAIGSIVDASIVILENIYRHLEMQKPPQQAAIDGAREVGGAVFGAVMTNAIVFVPIFLITGLPGQIFTPLAKTIISTMLCSLASAIFIVPMVASRILSAESLGDKKGFAKRFEDLWESYFENGLKVKYKNALAWCLNHRTLVVIVTFIVFVLSIVSGAQVRSAIMGKWDRGDFSINIETPVGSSLEHTERVVMDVETYLLENVPEIKSAVVDIGNLASSSMGRGSSDASPRLGGITVDLGDAEKRKRSVYEIQDEVIEQFRNYPGADIRVQEMFSIAGRSPVEILVRGDNLDELSRIGERIRIQLQRVPGLINLELSYRPGAPEYRIRIDRKAAASLALSAGQVYNTLRMLMEEDLVSVYREGGNEYDVIVQLPEQDRNSIEKIRHLRFMTPMGRQVALSEISNVEAEFGPASISRRDRSKYVSVQAGLSGRALSEVINEVRPILEEIDMPDGYTWQIGGEQQEQEEITGQLAQAMLLSLILVYVFLAVQFESFIHPFTIMIAVPLQLVGVFGALIITNSVRTMFAQLGMIMLVGIVVSASIVLIDYIIQRKKSGLGTKEAVLEAAPLRLRPIMMTVGTTMLAMTPLALGLSAGTAMFKELAIASIGGLATSTVLSLLIIPVIYTLMEDLSEKISGKKYKTKKNDSKENKDIAIEDE